MKCTNWRAISFLLSLFVFAVAGRAQNVITTVAGSTWVFRGDAGPATSAPLGHMQGVAVDAAGNVYASDIGNSLVVKVSPSGILTVVAGNGVGGFSGDGGPATNASLTPAGVAVDAAGNLYVADTDNNRIRKVSPSGMISTVAGNGTSGFSGDGGPAISASLNDPQGVAVDAAGNLYIADYGNNRIRKVNLSGIISTVAGSSARGYSGDGGPATSASLRDPCGVAVDAAGSVYIADAANHRVRRVTSSGIISTVAGNGTWAFSGDGGPATSASLWAPCGVAVDAAGNLYIADKYNDRIRKVSPSGIINTVAGNGAYKFAGDGGSATSASLNDPQGVAVDAAGNLYIADRYNSRIRKVSPAGVISTVAGSSARGYSGDGDPATIARLFWPSGVAVDTAGNLYIADHGNNRIRKVNPSGIISTVAGNGQWAFSGDGGPAISASLNDPQGVAVDAAGNLYIADYGNNRIRKVSPSGTISTVAGNGRYGFSGDGGPATSASLGWVEGVAVDAAGNLYIADTDNGIRKVSPSGIISTVVGNGTVGFSGDGGPATSASLKYPIAVAVDAAGNLYVADDNRIRKVTLAAPLINAGGVVLAAGYAQAPLAPGSILSLFGPNLSAVQGQASSLPLPRTTNGVRVLVNGQEAPLFYVSTTQINAQLPVELTPGTSAQVVVDNNGVSSTPETIQITTVSPGIFTLGPPFGQQGAVLIANTNVLAMPATAGVPSGPTQAGETVSVFCTGLGATDPAVASGSAAPSSPPAVVKSPVAVSIGGLPAMVSFAGLAPGYAGLYQVNAQVPAGIAPSDAVPVVITQGGARSNTATIAIGSGTPARNPQPVISSLSPPSAPSGTSSLTITINGSGFTASSTVTYNGVSHAATFVTSSQLTIALSAWDLAVAGSFAVVATNAPPGGGSAAAVNFAVVPAATTLQQAATPRAFLMGAAAEPSDTSPGRLNEVPYAATLSTQYNMLQPENAMKWRALHPTQETYYFQLGDELVKFGQAHGMKVRGCCLLWYKSASNPSWINDLAKSASAATMSSILQDHITTVLSHYKGQVFAWDVVNEAVSDSQSGVGTDLRSSIWYDSPGIGLSGTGYVEQAFRWAHAADPNALLFYNDFGIEGPGAKFDAVYRMLSDFVRRGVPIDGVGLQMHINPTSGYPSSSGLSQNIRQVAALGLQVHITEMDVGLAVNANGNATADDLQAQAQIYQRILTVCLQNPVCTAFQTWGFTDKYSWIASSYPGYGAALPFDANYQPKPAFTALMNALQTVPLPPHISSVSQVIAQPQLSITIRGNGFGSFPQALPYKGDSNYLQITNNTQGWNAGYTGNVCDVTVNQWSSTGISLVANVNEGGVSNLCPLSVGDRLTIQVWNPQTIAGPATYTVTVAAR